MTVIGCKLKQNANEGCNSCASLAGLVLSLSACFIFLWSLLYMSRCRGLPAELFHSRGPATTKHLSPSRVCVRASEGLSKCVDHLSPLLQDHVLSPDDSVVVGLLRNTQIRRLIESLLMGMTWIWRRKHHHLETLDATIKERAWNRYFGFALLKPSPN